MFMYLYCILFVFSSMLFQCLEIMAQHILGLNLFNKYKIIIFLKLINIKNVYVFILHIICLLFNAFYLVIFIILIDQHVNKEI